MLLEFKESESLMKCKKLIYKNTPSKSMCWTKNYIFPRSWDLSKTKRDINYKWNRFTLHYSDYTVCFWSFIN